MILDIQVNTDILTYSFNKICYLLQIYYRCYYFVWREHTQIK